VHNRAHQQAGRIGEDVALASLHHLAGIKPARAAGFRRLHRLAVDHGVFSHTGSDVVPGTRRCDNGGSWLSNFNPTAFLQRRIFFCPARIASKPS
jgi:hypothetical protein